MRALEREASCAASPELTRGFGFKICKGEEQKELVSREQFAHPASVCSWSNAPAGAAASGGGGSVAECFVTAHRALEEASFWGLSSPGRPGPHSGVGQSLGFSESK